MAKKKKPVALTIEIDAPEPETTPQHPSLKKAAKKLQKDFDKRLKDAVKLIRKDAEEKIREVVKAAERQLEEDAERLVGDALTSIVTYYQQPESAATTGKGRGKERNKSKKKGTGKKRAAAATSDHVAEMDDAGSGAIPDNNDGAGHVSSATLRTRRATQERTAESGADNSSASNRARGRKASAPAAKPAARRVGRAAPPMPPTASTDDTAPTPRRRAGRPRRAPGTDSAGGDAGGNSPS